ncbi:ribosome small subunit-dependent GTPase A [Faecalibaculum rodentium]|nr:ribosome small subunit-dependent GTPase A [Faecalibaculum rodentium]
MKRKEEAGKEPMEREGTVTKIISSQYTVQTPDGPVTAVPAGKLRRDRKPVVGDHVTVSRIQDSWRIEQIHPRQNELLRPRVANVDQALVVTSCKDPDFSQRLLDRLLFLTELSNIRPVILLTKTDLVDPGELEQLRRLLDLYAACGYTVLESCPGSGDEQLAALLKGRISVLCGQSGAGKSSLLNRLNPSFHLRTQEISKALGRGKHTTRHCELHEVAKGLVADTPGFSSLDFSRMDLSGLDRKLTAFSPWTGQCRFADCRHINEPDCAIKQAVDAGRIPQGLYDDYKFLKQEEQNRR